MFLEAFCIVVIVAIVQSAVEKDEVKKSNTHADWARCFPITRVEPYQYRKTKGTSPSETFGRRIPTKRYLSSYREIVYRWYFMVIIILYHTGWY